jgi:hypothetical protein
MRETGNEIRIIVNQASGLLASMESAKVSSRSNPEKWSRKEILGHLIDSAANNHQRFIRASCNAAAFFPTYSQNDWVRVQQYTKSDWMGLVELWSAYNRHLADVIERLPEEAASAPCNLGKENPATLEFVVKDYLRHMRHHLNQILERDI